MEKTNGKKKKTRIDIIWCGSLSAKKSWRFFSPLITEALGISIALYMLHFWIRSSSKPIKILTDHQPLKFLLKTTPMQDLSDKISRIKESMMKYNYQIHYLSAAKMVMADCLGRSPEGKADDIGDDVLNTQDVETRCCLAHTFKDIERIIEDPMLSSLLDSATDKEYTDIVNAIKEGKEAHEVADLPTGHPARKYTSDWNQMSVITNKKNYLLILDNKKVLIPIGSRQTILERVHLPHEGSKKTVAAANSIYSYKGLSKDIEEMCKICSSCAKESATIPATTEVAEDRPEDVMLKFGTDFFEIGNKMYILLNDYLSGFVWVSKEFATRTPRTADAIEFFTTTFNFTGWPKKIRLDSDTRYLSDAFTTS